MSDRPEREPRRDPASRARRARDGARALPALGLILITPPMAQAFAVEGRLFGVPVTVAYVFALWALLIFGAWRIGRRILETETRTTETGG